MRNRNLERCFTALQMVSNAGMNTSSISGPEGSKMTLRSVLYREFTPWNRSTYLFILGVVLLSCYPLLADSGRDASTIVAVIILGLVAVILVSIGGLTVVIRESEMILHLGLVPLITKTVPFKQIKYLRITKYRPIKDFGGWGLRGLGKQQLWSARGTDGLVLNLIEGSELIVGSDDPNKLKERICDLSGISFHE